VCRVDAVPAREIRIGWSWQELVAVRETIELTPSFAGRDDVRASLGRLSPGRGEIVLELAQAECLAANLLALDLPTAIAKAKLLRALRETEPSQPATIDVA
jgi:hypothetical protein